MVKKKWDFLVWFKSLFGGEKLRTEYDREISSPDGKVKLKISLKSGHLSYSVEKNGVVIVRKSRFGLALKNAELLKDHLGIVRVLEKTINETWETVWGEDRVVINNCHELTLYLSETSRTERLFTLRFRVFDDGVAFHYELPPQPSFSRVEIADELTEFNLDLNAEAWKIPAYQPDRY